MAARRASKRTFGSIRILPSGRYQARYTGPTGEVVPAPVTFTARMDAEAWLIAEREKHFEKPETGVAPRTRLQEAQRAEEAARLPTFREYAEKWIKNRRSSKGEPLRPTTRDKYMSNLRVHVFPEFGDTPLDEITRTTVRAWYDNLETGPAARADSYSTLRAILNTAVIDDELLARNPAYIRGAGVKSVYKKLRPATLAEVAVMVEAMPERRRLLLLLATWCALRSGELRELRRSDVILEVDDDAFGSVSVERGVVRPQTGESEPGRRTAAIVGDPKTPAGVRVVSIPGALIPVVRAHLDEHVAAGPDSLLFSSERDHSKHLAESTLNGRAAVLDPEGNIQTPGFGWREARRVAGREDLDLHDLRHTGASMAGEEGASIAELMHRLGHSTPAMAMRYQHSTQDRDRELGRKLSARAEKAIRTTTPRVPTVEVATSGRPRGSASVFSARTRSP